MLMMAMVFHAPCFLKPELTRLLSIILCFIVIMFHSSIMFTTAFRQNKGLVNINLNINLLALTLKNKDLYIASHPKISHVYPCLFHLLLRDQKHYHKS